MIYQGTEVSFAQLCAKHHLHPKTVRDRMANGKSIDEALSRPARKYPQDIHRTKPRPEVPILNAEPRCFRCDGERDIRTWSGWELCEVCRTAAVRLLREWISDDGATVRTRQGSH